MMIQRRSAMGLRCGLLGIAAVAGAGCESGSGSVRPAPGVEVVEHADPAGVVLLNENPSQVFVVVGRVRSAADARFEGRIPEARAAAERALRAQAASVGADAVIVDEAFIMDLDGGAVETGLGDLDDGRNLQRPGGAAFATRPVHRVVLIGRAIRWPREVGPVSPAPASP